MKTIGSVLLSALAFGLFLGEASATDRYFDDISAESPSKQYRVEAKSPDNTDKTETRAFQASFVYTCRDMTTKKVLWTRQQSMGEPILIGNMSIKPPLEASPAAIFVSDAGWTMIWNGAHELIAVDSSGRDRCRVAILTEGFTDEENSEYVHLTTAGPSWSGYSHWYFLDVGDSHLFVVRPWWGRRVVVNLETGQVLESTPDVLRKAEASERRYVITELAKGVDTLKKSDKEGASQASWHILTAAYLAGRLPVPEAGDYLAQLQDSSYSGSSTGGGLGLGERFEGQVNPHSYHTFTLRQVAQFSLRRLGKTPRPLPAYQFDVTFEEYEKNYPYAPKELTGPRATNTDKIMPGMNAEQILDLIGSPDFVSYDTWEYDMDADPPFSLILKWDGRQVVNVQKKVPPLWKEGFVRDKEIVW